jgi:hypothetical protein
MTTGQRQRLKRNLTIAASKRAGLSFRQIAAAVGLSVARTKAIYDDLKDEVAVKSERREFLLNGDVLRN